MMYNYILKINSMYKYHFTFFNTNYQFVMCFLTINSIFHNSRITTVMLGIKVKWHMGAYLGKGTYFFFFIFFLLLNSVFTVLPLRQVHRDMVKYNVSWQRNIYTVIYIK